MKKILSHIILLGIIVISLASCSKSSFDYLGKSYPATASPEIFMRDQDVPYDYEVMGKVTAEVPYSKKLKYIQNKVMNLASQNGADAVLFSDVDIRSTGYTKASGGASTGGKRGVLGGSVSKVNDSEVKRVEAVLLKYKSK
ncbi:MAG: hypothetical protein K9H16_01560 [Bacteroidales bacterium]|nr:hypothetical protein [Bacteroidales bacterium]